MPRFTSRRILVAIVLLTAAAWSVERLVVTDREAIESVHEQAAASVSGDDWEGFAGTIADDYAEQGRDKEAFVAHVRGMKQRHRPEGLGIEIREPNVEGDRAEARVFVMPGPPYVGYRIEGVAHLVRSPNGWRISRVSQEEARFLGR